MFISYVWKMLERGLTCCEGDLLIGECEHLTESATTDSWWCSCLPWCFSSPGQVLLPCLRPIRGQYPGHVITLDQSVTVLHPCLRHQSCSAQRARHTINLSLFVGLTFAKCCYQSMVTLNTMGIYTTWSLHHYCHNIKGHCKSIKERYTRGTCWVGVLFL